MRERSEEEGGGRPRLYFLALILGLRRAARHSSPLFCIHSEHVARHGLGRVRSNRLFRCLVLRHETQGRRPWQNKCTTKVHIARCEFTSSYIRFTFTIVESGPEIFMLDFMISRRNKIWISHLRNRCIHTPSTCIHVESLVSMSLYTTCTTMS
jgi:hypothetical protein